MYAVIRSGGKQHRVIKGERVRVDKLIGDVGSDITLNDILMIGGDTIKIGTPNVEGAAVTAKIVAQDRGAKIYAFKRLKRKGFHKKIGHRQHYTELEITGIQA